MPAIVSYPPTPAAPLPDDIHSVFLAGTIDMGASLDWQSKVTTMAAMWPQTVHFLNPRRADWDSSWVQNINDTNFRGQVEWELDHIQSADIVAMHFEEDSLSPVTLLELGLAAACSKTVVVSCPPKFWRRGNVQIVCDRYDIPLHNNLDGMLSELFYRTAV